ncbi:MAG: putative methyltransferase [Microgenomates group bacterium Gr01-1014_93]|nr:MAG: putative methyltransferase [Microgenomates group bacterium Gr01-1014_93]
MVKTLIKIHEDVPADHYDKGIKNNLFQKYWHWRRFREVLKMVNSVDGPILDIGCHSGTFTEKILKKIGTREVYGIDISESAIKKISKRIPYGHFEVADAASLPFKNDFFDLAVCLEVLEHVDNPQKVISEIKRVLKKDGKVVMLVPADNKLFKIVWFVWTLYYPVWRHAHVQSFSGQGLEDLIKSAGLKIKYIKTFNLGMLKFVVAKKNE